MLDVRNAPADYNNLEFLKKKKIFQKSAEKYSGESLVSKWKGSVLHKESSLHQISPYIGKMKSSMARELIATFTKEGETLYDPYAGSGSVALEAWAAGRNIIANDLSPYAVMLTRAKLFPCLSTDEAIFEINKFDKQVKKLVLNVDLRKIPRWVRIFFHPETLREIVAWVQLLRLRKAYFLLSCLLGILHHERPGFLSYPSSHTVPYLRDKKYPREVYPELYQYRPVKERLEKKVVRVLKRVPEFDPRLIRECYLADASRFLPNHKINAIVTSPPYMRQLNYGRDNRLRLWLLGVNDWKSLDKSISPSEATFLNLFRSCLNLWHEVLSDNGLCVFVLGDVYCRSYDLPLHGVIAHMANKEIGRYTVVWKYTETIPNIRRVRRNCSGSVTETVLVLRKEQVQEEGH